LKREITREYTHFKVKNQLVCQLSFAWNDSAPLINRTSNIAAERGRKSPGAHRLSYAAFGSQHVAQWLSVLHWYERQRLSKPAPTTA
jgi:hypothetical protein